MGAGVETTGFAVVGRCEEQPVSAETNAIATIA
jgi:hypothetical protein